MRRVTKIVRKMQKRQEFVGFGGTTLLDGSLDLPAFRRCAALDADPASIQKWAMKVLRRDTAVAKRTLDWEQEEGRLASMLPKTLERLEAIHAWEQAL